MAKINEAEAYGIEESEKWLYDKDGYCPFSEHKLSALLRKAFEDGAASVTKTSALTPKQRDALVDVLNERLAGGWEDLRDAMGMDNKEAKEMERILERVRSKLLSKETQDRPAPAPVGHRIVEVHGGSK